MVGKHIYLYFDERFTQFIILCTFWRGPSHKWDKVLIFMGIVNILHVCSNCTCMMSSIIESSYKSIKHFFHLFLNSSYKFVNASNKKNVMFCNFFNLNISVSFSLMKWLNYLPDSSHAIWEQWYKNKDIFANKY